MIGTPQEVNRFVDWCYGKEADATYGSVSNLVRDHVTRRPAVGGTARWESLESLQTINAYYGYAAPNALSGAIAAFRGGAD